MKQDLGCWNTQWIETCFDIWERQNFRLVQKFIQTSLEGLFTLRVWWIPSISSCEMPVKTIQIPGDISNNCWSTSSPLYRKIITKGQYAKWKRTKLKFWITATTMPSDMDITFRYYQFKIKSTLKRYAM